MRSEVQILPGPPLPATRAGGVAQLGERLLCKQEVIGSIPFSSTRRLADWRPIGAGVLLRRPGMGRGPEGGPVRCCLTSWIGCVPARAGSLAEPSGFRALSPGPDREEVLSVASEAPGGLAGWPLRASLGEIKRLRAFGGCLGTERR